MTRITSQLAAMVGAFVGGTLIAELLGANNTGIALGVGQIAFLAVTTYLIVRPKRGPQHGHTPGNS
jgi:predicted MFS family arabinose efflux permease